MPWFAPSRTRRIRGGGLPRERRASDAEMAMEQIGACTQLAGRQVSHDLALDQYHAAGGGPQDRSDLAIDEERGDSVPAERSDDAPDLLSDERGEPLGRFVEQQRIGIREQCPPDSEHLLLSAGELIAAMREPRAESGERREH